MYTDLPKLVVLYVLFFVFNFLPIYNVYAWE